MYREGMNIDAAVGILEIFARFVQMLGYLPPKSVFPSQLLYP